MTIKQLIATGILGLASTSIMADNIKGDAAFNTLTYSSGAGQWQNNQCTVFEMIDLVSFSSPSPHLNDTKHHLVTLARIAKEQSSLQPIITDTPDMYHYIEATIPHQYNCIKINIDTDMQAFYRGEAKIDWTKGGKVQKLDPIHETFK